MENLCIPVYKFIFENRIAALQIQISHKAVPIWCTNLSLLREGLIQQIEILSDNKHSPITINVTKKQKGVNSNYQWTNPNQINFALSKNELESWLYFFLKGYRDNEFPVDHIDIECYPINSSLSDIDLTIQVDKYQKPMSKEELDLYLANLE